jgi:hypothetical protein
MAPTRNETPGIVRMKFGARTVLKTLERMKSLTDLHPRPRLRPIESVTARLSSDQ